MKRNGEQYKYLSDIFVRNMEVRNIEIKFLGRINGKMDMALYSFFRRDLPELKYFLFGKIRTDKTGVFIGKGYIITYPDGKIRMKDTNIRMQQFFQFFDAEDLFDKRNYDRKFTLSVDQNIDMSNAKIRKGII